MGHRPPSTHVLEWQSDLAGMKKHGTRIRASCQTCGHWWDLDVDEMIRELGSDKASLWDRSPPCEIEACGGIATCHASPGPGTPTRPLVSIDLPPGVELPIQSLSDGWRGYWATPTREHIPHADKGFTERDWRRIKALALSVTDNHMPAALDDLDAPYRVGACTPEWESRFSGRKIATFRGMVILAWPKEGRRRG
jgi:hypothetical protein